MLPTLGSFTCPNLIKSSINNEIVINWTDAVYRSTQALLLIGSDYTFRCEFNDVGLVKNLAVTGKYDPETFELTLYNELLPEEISGEKALISFALNTKDGLSFNGVSLFSNNCYGSNGTLAPLQTYMTSLISENDSKSYQCYIKSNDVDQKSTCTLPKSWPKKTEYKDLNSYLIDCCKYSLYFRDVCLFASISACNSVNQLISSNYCS